MLLSIFLTKQKSTETDLVPRFLLIVFQGVQVCNGGCVKELFINISVNGTVSTISTHTDHFICRGTSNKGKLHQVFHKRHAEKFPPAGEIEDSNNILKSRTFFCLKVSAFILLLTSFPQRNNEVKCQWAMTLHTLVTLNNSILKPTPHSVYQPGFGNVSSSAASRAYRGSGGMELISV